MIKYRLRKSIQCGCNINIREVGYIYSIGPFADINVAYKAAEEKNIGYSRDCCCRCEVIEVDE